MTNVVVVRSSGDGSGDGSGSSSGDGSGTDSALAGVSFSSAYDCTGKSDAIKYTVNAVAAAGCCGGNSNGKAILCLFLALLIILR